LAKNGFRKAKAHRHTAHRPGDATGPVTKCIAELL
jgi:hypothetical protein